MALPESPVEDGPTEITALLPPSNQPGPSTRAKPPPYTATSSPRVTQPPPRPIPLRKSPYSTWSIWLTFIALVLCAFISTTFTVLLALNIPFPRAISPYLPTHRSTRALPLWYSAMATWLTLSTLTLFWSPSRAARWSLILAAALAAFDVIFLCLVPELIHQENILTILTCLLALVVVILSLISNNLIRTADAEQGKIIENRATNLREAERRAELLLVAEERDYWSRQLWRAFKLTASFLFIFFTSTVLLLMTVDLIIRAVDSTYHLPFRNSQMLWVRPGNSGLKIKVHVTCTGPSALRPPKRSLPRNLSAKKGGTQKVPTALYEAPTHVSGTEGANWLMNMREKGEIGRLCFWDRPGYGFSDASPNSEAGYVVDALWEALQANGEKGPYVLVGEGYGGLLHRIFSARHAPSVHGHVYIDAETSQTYFLGPSRRRALNMLVPYLLSPLSLHRIITPSLHVIQPNSTGSSRLNRILSPMLNPLMLSTRYDEHRLSHTTSSPSFTTLLTSLKDYPSDLPTIVLSNAERMTNEKRWMSGQKSLWEEVTDERGRVRWEQVEGISSSKRMCSQNSTGLPFCEDAVMELVWS